MSKSNVIKEIQELIQQIKTEYQKGIDYKFVAENLINSASGGVHLQILSPKLKKFCREKFNFPSSVDYNLDYEKGDQEGNDFYYRVYVDNNDYDILDYAKGELYRFNDNSKEPKKCKFCGKLDSYENGRVVLWGGRKITGFRNPTPNIIAYFHPECAKKYFANKGRSNKNNVQIKEKLLQNLDKLCLDPDGYLASSEYLKADGCEEEYKRLFRNDQSNWKDRYLKIIVDGEEEIDLYDFDNASGEYYEVKRELVKKIAEEIRQNPSEWRIEQGKNENYVDKNLNQVVKHQPSGRRYWKLAIDHYWGGNSSEIGKYWKGIEALIWNGSSSSTDNQESNIDLRKLKNIFRKYSIRKVTFEDGSLFVEYENEVNSVSRSVNSQEFAELRNYCQKHGEKEISWEMLNNSSTNVENTKSSQFENKYLWLAGGITLGIMVSVLLSLLLRRKKKKN